MSQRWPSKYVIGLTGNIATGKSVVRKMLEHLGAFTIDADQLSHQALARGGPAHGPVLKAFGDWLLTPEGEIDRARLGKLAFGDPGALEKLEAIIHPVVGQAIEILVKRARAPVVCLEAIKLIETGLSGDCDALWAVNVPEPMQLLRLVEKRKLTETEALERIVAQSPQELKVKAAGVVIDNGGSFEDTWTQVQAAFSRITPPAGAPLPSDTQPVTPVAAPASAADSAVKNIKIRRGKPTDATGIADLIKQLTNGARSLSRGDIMAAFGEKAYMLGDADGSLAAIAGFKVENLVARIDELYLSPGVPLPLILPPLMEAVEYAVKELQCEAALVFVPQAQMAAFSKALAAAEFTPQEPAKLNVASWQDAAKESQPAGTEMLFKKLREDRVLRPI